MVSRRKFVAGVAGLVVLSGRSQRLAALTAVPITIYKSRTCGCCAKWVDHVRENGFRTTVHDEEEMDRLKDQWKVPAPVRSCHTAKVGGYLIEGHVPAVDIHRLLTERPKVAGLAVPGMPAGTPGMAEPGQEGDYEVLAFQFDGSTSHFASH
ncbi:MAG TPA: DUF411 domain-containing protein [Gemmatimonadales bacterium]|nr:DUF411 domain-containing protein [Gemmatimonadales bacterium]